MCFSLRPVFALALFVLGGCAAPVMPAAVQDPPMRWLLTWHRPLAGDPAAVARFETDVSAVARVPVQRLAAVSERIVAVGIDCGDAAICQAVRDRLRADPRVLDLQPDARRRAHGP